MHFSRHFPMGLLVQCTFPVILRFQKKKMSTFQNFSKSRIPYVLYAPEIHISLCNNGFIDLGGVK